VPDRRFINWRLWVGLLAIGVLVGAAFSLSNVSRVAGPLPATGVGQIALADPITTFDPVRSGEPVPEGFRQLLHRDVIQTVYHPRFVSAFEVDWDPDTLVIGVELRGDARAYPVNYMNVHEMVNDTVGGIPALVSW
jgi:hypothetical protein